MKYLLAYYIIPLTITNLLPINIRQSSYQSHSLKVNNHPFLLLQLSYCEHITIINDSDRLLCFLREQHLFGRQLEASYTCIVNQKLTLITRG